MLFTVWNPKQVAPSEKTHNEINSFKEEKETKFKNPLFWSSNCPFSFFLFSWGTMAYLSFSVYFFRNKETERQTKGEGEGWYKWNHKSLAHESFSSVCASLSLSLSLSEYHIAVSLPLAGLEQGAKSVRIVGGRGFF